MLFRSPINKDGPMILRYFTGLIFSITKTLASMKIISTAKQIRIKIIGSSELKINSVFPDKTKLKMLIKIKQGIRDTTALSKLAKIKLSSATKSEMTGNLPFIVNMITPINTAKNIICRVFPSKNGRIKLVGMIPKIISNT